MLGRKPKNITGKRSCGGKGKLTAISPTKERRNREVVWLCKCDCGKLHKIRVGLFSTTNSCGCLQRYHLFDNTYSLKHGHTGKKWNGKKSPTFISWEKMKDRVLNSKHKKFEYYGKRGITICERWMKFENFLEDMGERPKNYSLHRIDNSKGYNPKNCKWKETSKHIGDHNKDFQKKYGKTKTGKVLK